jgi:hypothetical protein
MTRGAFILALALAFTGCKESSFDTLDRFDLFEPVTLLKSNKKPVTLSAGAQNLQIRFSSKKDDGFVRSAMTLKTSDKAQLPFDLGALEIVVTTNRFGKKVPRNLEKIQTPASETQQGVGIAFNVASREYVNRQYETTESCTRYEYETICRDVPETICVTRPGGGRDCRTVWRRVCDRVSRPYPGYRRVFTREYGDITSYTLAMTASDGRAIGQGLLNVDAVSVDRQEGTCY